MTPTKLTVDDLNKLTKFVHQLNVLTKEHGVAVDSFDDQFILIGGSRVPVNLEYDEHDGYSVWVGLSL